MIEDILCLLNKNKRRWFTAEEISKILNVDPKRIHYKLTKLSLRKMLDARIGKKRHKTNHKFMREYKWRS